jgi:hypothetical protein
MESQDVGGKLQQESVSMAALKISFVKQVSSLLTFPSLPH